MKPNEKENSELKAALEWYRDEALATDAARRVLHELSIYKNNNPEKYGFAEDIELLARAALEGGVSRTEPALTDLQIEMDLWPRLRLGGIAISLHECLMVMHTVRALVGQS